MHRHTHSHNHSQGSLPRGRPVIPEEGAKASDWFEQFLTAPTLKTIFGSYRNICEYLHLKPNVLPLFYPKLKNHINSWKAKPLWKKFDTRANQKCYGRGKACPHTRVLIIGAGPCGLRTAIEAQLLGAKVVVVEKRDRMSRNNVLHLWPFVIDDLRALGAKKFFGKFCAGSIDHISIRQLQCILLKVALLLGVEIHTEVSFERLIEPNPNEKTGWRAEFKPAEHPVSQFEFDVIIGADGKRNTLQGFKRKEFRGKLAIAITANFINKRTEAEARVEEISGVAFIFNQKFFKDLYAETGIDLENIVYYKDDTHYFVMTAKKQSLIDKGVIKEDLADTARLLAPDNVDREELMNYAREAAEFSTNYQMPDLEFAVNHYGHPDVAMFDFTSMYAAENASRVIERHNYKLLSILVGDSLLEPFWPTGSGCARGFLSSMDAAWAIRSWDSDTVTPLEVIAERESIYRLLAQTTPENLNKDYKSYTLDPSTRYPNLNKNALLAHQVTNLYDTDDPKSIELNPRPTPAIVEVPKKRRRRESHVDPDTLLSWIKEQVREHEDLEVTNLTTSFRDGRVLCAIISHYRPDLLDYSAINAHDFVRNNQVVFDLLEKELGVPPIMTGEEMAENDSPDFLTMLAYLTKVYDTFRCEIPHIKYPKWDKNLTITRTSAVILPSFEYPLKPLLITPHSSAKVSDEGTYYGLSSEESFPTSILTPNNTKVTTQDNLILIPIKSIEDYLLKDGVEVAKKSDDEILILKDVLDSTENIEGANSSKCRLSKSDPLFSSIHNSSKSSKVSIVCKKLPLLKRNSTKSITSRNSTEQKQKRNKYTQSKRDMVRYLSDDTSQNISGSIFDYSGDYINDPRQKQMKTFNIKIKPSKCTTCKKQVVKVKFSSRNKVKKLKRQKQERPKHTDLIDILNILTYSEDEISSVASQCSMAGSAQITLNFLQEMDEFLQKQDLAYEELKSTKNNLKVEIKSPKMNIPRDIPPILHENDVFEENEDYPDIIIKNIERKSSSTVAVQVVKFFSISKCLNIIPRLISNVSSSLNLNFFGSKDPVCLEKVNKRRKDICQRKFPPDQTLAKVEGWIKSSNFESESTVIDEYNEPLKNLSKSTVENDSDSVITSVTKEEWVRKMERVNQGMEIKTKHSTAVNSHESVESMAKLVETLKSNNTIKGVAKINSISSPWELYEGRTKSKSEPPDQFSTIIEAEEPDMPEVKRTENVFKIRTNVDKTDIFASTVPPPRPSSRHKRHVDTSFLNKPSTALSQDRKARKRKTLEKVGASVEDRQRRLEDIVSNRVDRHNKRRQQRKMQTEQFIKSMQMLQSNCKPDHSEPFEDYSIYLYRQTAPNFEDRVKNLEKQFIYVPDKESRIVPTQTKRETDEDFAARIKDLEDKWREPVSVEKKPKDLLRAIGKIETSDWNIKEIEKKIIENKLGKTVNKDKEKVPKWSREQFLARQTKMERQHIDRQNSTEVKFADIDRNIKQLELKLKEGSVRDLNQHKVASITEKLVGKTTEPPTTTAQSSKPIQKSSSRTVIPISQGSEFCHFCSKRVYLVERLTAEGRIFHTGCFRCQYCHTSLRLGTYMFDREGLYEHRFYCAQHFGMPGEISRPEKKVVEIQETPQKKIVSNVLGVDLLDRVQTPERIEFSNLSTGHISSDHDESPSPIDEDEWTDRNNINSVVDSDSSDDSSSTSDTDSDDEAYEEALEEPITKEGTLRWAERYKKRYSRKDHESNSDGYSSSDHFSYYENSSGDDDSDTATEGEEEIRARELRKQEVRVEPPIDAGTDTEVKPLSNYPFDSNDSNLVSNQTPCTVDMPDILNNTLKVSKSSDNMSSTNEQFNSAESELDDMYKHEMRDIRNQEPPTPNSLSKSSTTSSISSTPVKRNFVLPPKERRSSFGKEFVPVVEQEPLLVIKRTPSKINLPPEIGKPKVQVKINVDSAKKYFGELRKPFISKPPIDKSKKPPIIKQASLPERSTITVAHAQNKEESKEGRRESIFNFEPEENDLEEIDNYIENLMKGEKQVLHPVKAGKNEDEREEEKVSSSIEDLLKALEVETNVEENEIVEVKPEEKIEDLLNWIEELDHKAEDSHITSSLKPDKYKNLENVLKKPREVDNVIHKLSKDNITQFENHLLGKNQNVPEDNNDNYQLSKSKTDVNCNKPRNSVDLDAVKKVDIKKVLEKFENNEGQQQDFKQPRRSIVVPKNIVKRNSFANFSFNRSFEKDDKQPMYDQHRDSIGSKDFKMRAEMFEKKLKRFDDQNDETRFNPSQEGFEGNSRRSPLSWKVNQLKSNSQSPHRTNDDSLGRSSSLLRRFEIKASSESPQRSKNTSVVDQSGKPAFLQVNREKSNNDSSPHRDTSPSFLRKFPHLKSGSKSPNRLADNDGNLNEGVSFLEKSISSSKLLSGKTEDATGDSDDDSLKSPSLLKKILELESIRRQLQNTESTPVADGHNLNKSPVALKELDEIKPEVESKPKSIVNLVENISFLQPKTDSSQRTEDEVNLCRTTSETGQDDDGNNLADINLGSRLDESNAHKSTEIDNTLSGTPFLQNLSQIPDDRNSFYDKIQLDQLLTNTRQTKDEIVGNNHRETINSENKSDGKLESNSESNAGQGNNGNDLDFYDITLDNEAQSPVRENYFQALVTVKNIIKNLNLQQETGLNPNTEIEIQPNAIEPGFNEDVSIKGENVIDEGNREGINLDNVVECAGDIESNLPRKEKVYQEVNDDSVLKGNENRNENIENKLEDGSICEKIEPNIDKVIEEKNQVHRSSVKKQNVVDSKKLNKKPSLEFVTVEKHPLLTEKPSSSIIIDLPKIQLVESTNTNKKETSPRPVPPQRSKKEHISMIPRLTNPHASKNFIRPQQSSIRAASASPGVSRRMETAFAPVPPVRKKSSTSTAAPNLGDKNMELNQTKLNERSTSADNLGTSKRQSDTLRGKLFSKSKEKECSIQ